MDSTEQKWYTKAWFWIKIGLWVALAFILTILGVNAWEHIMRFLGFRKKKENRVTINKITKVDTGQNKTTNTKDFIEMMKKKYLK